MPAVSVITPAWNAARHLRATIDSVRAQTFKDWELIIVDDGSTDETVSLIRACAAADSRIRLLRQANAGPSAARNRGMAAASGELIAFLDSDDLWAPTFLQSQLDVFARYPDADLVTGNGYFLGGPFHGKPVRVLRDGCRALPLAEVIADECAIFIMTVFRRRVFDTIGGLDEEQWTSEDYDFWIRAALAGFRFRQNPEPLGWYRVRGDSLSRDRARMIRGILQTFGKARPHCPPDSAARRALDLQVERFECELLLEEAKDAIERGDLGRAAELLRSLRGRGGGPLIGVTAWLATHAPPVARLAYRARRWAPAWLRERRKAMAPVREAAA